MQTEYHVVTVQSQKAKKKNYHINSNNKDDSMFSIYVEALNKCKNNLITIYRTVLLQ